MVTLEKDNVVVLITSRNSPYSDGNLYHVVQTGFESESERVAINNGSAYIRRMLKRRKKVTRSKAPKPKPYYEKVERTKPASTLAKILKEFNSSNKGKMAMLRIGWTYEMVRRTKYVKKIKRKKRNVYII